MSEPGAEPTWKTGHALCTTCGRRDCCEFWEQQVKTGAQTVTLCWEYQKEPQSALV
jgi:hypothetical protein